MVEVARRLQISPKVVEAYLQKTKSGRYIVDRQQNSTALEAKIRQFSLKQFWHQQRIFFLILTVLVIFSYANALGNNFVSDDIPGIVHNPSLKEPFSFFGQNFRFGGLLQHFLQSIVYLIFGLKPAAFRSLNLLFHLSNVFLVYTLVFLLTSPTIAFAAAALTAVHPLMSEAVVWISALSYPLYTFFSFLSLLFYLLSARKETYFYLAILTMVFSFSASEKAISLPLLLLILGPLLKIKLNNLKRIGTIVAPTTLMILYLWQKMPLRAQALQSQYYTPMPKFANWLQLIQTQLANTIVALSSYLNLIFWPQALSFYHSEVSANQASHLGPLLIFLIFLIALFWAYRREKQLFFFLLWFPLALAPTITPFGISWLVAERYAYFAAIGIFITVAIILKKLTTQINNQQIYYLLLGFLIFPLGIRTIGRNQDWRTQDSLWLATAKTAPSSPKNHNNLGDLYARRGNYPRAIKEFKTAIKLNPLYADAYHNLANTYLQQGKTKEAVANYQKALQLNPHLWQSEQNLAVVFFRQKKYQAAEQHLLKAIKIVPDNTKLIADLTTVLLKEKKTSQAKKLLQKALQRHPNDTTLRRLVLQTDTAPTP